MSDRSPGPDLTPPPGLRRRLALARLALIWEFLWPALWPSWLALGIFLALALFDVPAMLPGWLQALLLAALAAIVAFNLIAALRRFRPPRMRKRAAASRPPACSRTVRSPRSRTGSRAARWYGWE